MFDLEIEIMHPLTKSLASGETQFRHCPLNTSVYSHVNMPTEDSKLLSNVIDKKQTGWV